MYMLCIVSVVNSNLLCYEILGGGNPSVPSPLPNLKPCLGDSHTGHTGGWEIFSWLFFTVESIPKSEAGMEQQLAFKKLSVGLGSL